MAQVNHVLKAPLDTDTPTGRWTLQGPIDWREWDGEFVVRHDPSATTYLLTALAGETLRALREGAAHLDEIALRVLHDAAPRSVATAALIASFADTAADTKGLLSVLHELEGLGLVRASPT